MYASLLSDTTANIQKSRTHHFCVSRNDVSDVFIYECVVRIWKTALHSAVLFVSTEDVSRRDLRGINRLYDSQGVV